MVYINYQCIKTAEKMTIEEWLFLLQRKVMAFAYVDCNCFLAFFLILLRYKQNNELETAAATKKW